MVLGGITDIDIYDSHVPYLVARAYDTYSIHTKDDTAARLLFIVI